MTRPHLGPGTIGFSAGEYRRNDMNKLPVKTESSFKSKISIPHLSYFSSHLSEEEAGRQPVREESMVRLSKNERPHVREVQDLSKFYFYAVNKLKFLISVQELYDCVRRYLVREDFWVKRIRKSRGRLYLRLGISKRVSAAQRELVLQKVSWKLDVDLKPLKMAVNHTIESQDVDSDGSRNLTVLTLNMNRMEGRKEELAVMLSKLKPDIICLQETHVGSSEKKTWLPGYITFEVPEGNNGLGLLVGHRRKLDLTIAIHKTDPNYICFYVFCSGTKAMICNIYRSLTYHGKKKFF